MSASSHHSQKIAAIDADLHLREMARARREAESIVSRYLTVGGATVDITKIAGYVDRPEPTHTQAICTGCEETHAVEWLYQGSYGQLRDEDGQRATPQARDWAQEHASICRAMPKLQGPLAADDFGDGAW